LDGFIQSDTLDFSCVLSGDSKLEVMDFDCDSIGNQIYFLKYIGKQFFHGQQFDCIDGNERYVIMKLNAAGNLIWKQDLNMTLANISIANIGLLSDGNIVLALTHGIGIGVTTQYTYSLGGRNFSFNNLYSNIIKLNINGQYIFNKSISNVFFTFFDINNNNAAGFIYKNFSNSSYPFIAELINCNSNTLARIWQYIAPLNTISNFFSIGMHPTENSIYYTYTSTVINTTTLKLAKFENASTTILISLGTASGPNSSYGYGYNKQNGIAFINNTIHLSTPTYWSVTFNNQTYNGFLHLSVSSINNTLTNVFIRSRGDGRDLNTIWMKRCGSYIIESVRCSENIISSAQQAYEYLFNIYDEAGNIKYSNFNCVSIYNNQVNLANIQSYSNKIIISGSYFNQVNSFQFLNFNLTRRNSNIFDSFVFYLNLPN
jgi:hypothetical protein